MKFTRVLHIFLVCNYILKMEFPCIARQCLIDKPTPPEGHVAVFREMGRFYDSLVCWSKQKWRIFGDGRSLKVARSRELLPNVVLLICLHFERKTSQM